MDEIKLGLATALFVAAPAFAETTRPDSSISDLKLPTMLADAHEMTEGAADTAKAEKVDNYEVCAAFQADRDADLGAHWQRGHAVQPVRRL
jgi:hypothetical protein